MLLKNWRKELVICLFGGHILFILINFYKYFNMREYNNIGGI